MACSGRAVESTIIAFTPPVSARKAVSIGEFSAILLLIFWAVSVDPVKQTPLIFLLDERIFPTTSPFPGIN